MESLVNKNDIQTYAKRNTSPKMGIEQLYLQAFIDSMLNSSALKEKFQVLSDEMQNGDSFVIFGSYDVTARNLNKEPYRSILAYSMLASNCLRNWPVQSILAMDTFAQGDCGIQQRISISWGRCAEHQPCQEPRSVPPANGGSQSHDYQKSNQLPLAL